MKASLKTARRGLAAVLGFVCFACAGGPRGVEPQEGKEGGSAMTADLSGVDHVILGVNDLQRGIEELERLTGVRAVYGGAHPGRGTHNALISLGGAQYLEILAPNPEDAGSTPWIGQLETLASLTPVGWAARSHDLAALQQSLKSEGIETGEIRPGARNRPDGTRLAWKTLDLTAPSPLLPFFIEWDPAGAHPSATSPQGCRLTGFVLHDPAPEPLRKPLQAAGLGVEVRQAEKPGLWISMACPKGEVELR
jgi:Glyoxalase-like domain